MSIHAQNALCDMSMMLAAVAGLDRRINSMLAGERGG
jgi:hypothetical protein